MGYTGDKKMEYQRQWMYDRRATAIDYLGGYCVDCKTDKDLEFDHLNRAEKEHNISSILSSKWAKLKKELDKCVLRCHTCHKKKTLGEITHPITHGNYYTGYRKGCRCSECLESYRYRCRLGRFRRSLVKLR